MFVEVHKSLQDTFKMLKVVVVLSTGATKEQWVRVSLFALCFWSYLYAGDLKFAFHATKATYGAPLGLHVIRDANGFYSMRHVAFIFRDDNSGNVSACKEESGSNSNFFYSFDAGVHFIMLAAYIDYNRTGKYPLPPSGEQYFPQRFQSDWLLKDLHRIDRSVNPWVVAAWNPPWYNSYSSHY
ncbi:hypothetical protein M9H77_00421 [Catharanthus roseus]|nr:hypothetical protein M9H77_00421 [Catharanthus roseus]